MLILESYGDTTNSHFVDFERTTSLLVLVSLDLHFLLFYFFGFWKSFQFFDPDDGSGKLYGVHWEYLAGG